MRNIILLLLLVTVSFGACKKDSTTPPAPGGGTNPPPPPPGGSSGITITKISSLNPYAGDVITITGTGFDPDKTKDTVDMGFVINGNFSQDGAHLVNPSTTKIISASSTEIKFTNDSAMTVTTFNGEAPVAFRVRAPGKKYFTGDTILFKDNVKFGFTRTDPVGSAFCYAALYTGDSIYVEGTGLYPPLTMNAGGKTIQLFTVSKPNYQGRESVTGYIPIAFFGGSAPDPNSCPLLTNLDQFTITNGDGRSYTTGYQFVHGPNSVIAGASLDQLVYSVKAGHNPILTLTGYALRSDYTLYINGLASNSVPFSEENSFPIGNYPNTATQTIDLGALPAPPGSSLESYNISLKIGNGSYGVPIASFSLIP